MKTQVYDRFKDFDKSHCWQYEVRLQNLEEDLEELGITKEQVSQLRIEDFDFSYVDKTDEEQCQEINSLFSVMSGWESSPIAQRIGLLLD